MKTLILAWLLMCAPSASDHDLKENLHPVQTFVDGDECELREQEITEGYCFCVPNPDYPIVKPLTFI